MSLRVMQGKDPSGRRPGVGPAALMVARILTGSVAVAAAWTVLIGHAEARTEPFEGVGEAPLGRGTAGRKQALARARDAALRAAIESLAEPTDPQAQARVLARTDGWTGAYRILEEREADQSLEVRVEVEVDLARLRKELTTRPTPSVQGFRFAGVRFDAASGCGGLDEARLRDSLGRAGVLANDAGAAALSLEVRCEAAGAIPYTFVHASRFVASAKLDGQVAAQVETFGYGDDPAAAIDAAVGEGLGGLTEALRAEARGGLMLRIESPWPTSRVRHLQTRIEQALVGVSGVSLDGLEAGGVVRLHLDTELGAAEIEPRLRTLDLTGFQLHGIRVDSPHALTVRLD